MPQHRPLTVALGSLAEREDPLVTFAQQRFAARRDPVVNAPAIPFSGEEVATGKPRQGDPSRRRGKPQLAEQANQPSRPDAPIAPGQIGAKQGDDQVLGLWLEGQHEGSLQLTPQ
jgi:hypothetical protein